MKPIVRKLPIIIPLVLVATLLIGAAVASRLGLDTARSHTDMGRKHPENGDYSSATTEFLRSLSLDPTSRDARIGLAKVYAESGEEGSAEEILRPLLDSNDEEAYRFLVESRQGNDPAGALIAAETLVSKTDREEDYELRNELMNEVMNEAHSYAAGTDQTLAIVNGKVLSRGSNTLGQLGIQAGLGTNDVTDTFADAGFIGAPSRVYCAGRTSLVLDSVGVLWSAGENRWGQQGVDRMSTVPVAGWTRIADNVVSAAGTTGALFVLKSDGTLWYSGRGGITEPAQITSLGTVCAVDSCSDRTAVLTADGYLFTSSSSEPLRFVRTASNVKCFSLKDGYGLVWVTGDNAICMERGSISVPQEWGLNDFGPVADFTVADIAVTDGDIILLGIDSVARLLSNGSVMTLSDEVVSLSQSRDGAVLRYADSTCAICSSGSSILDLS